MQKLPQPRETYIPILQILRDGSEHRNGDICSKVNDKKGWGVWNLYHAGYIEKTKPAWYKIAGKGLQAFEKGELNHKTVISQKEYIERQQRRKQEKEQSNNQNNNFRETTTQEESMNSDESTPFALIDRGEQEIKEHVKDTLLEKLREIDPYVFEAIVLSLLKAMGYGETESTAKSRDGGIDGIIYEDKLGLDKIYIQAKRFNENKVRENEIRNFIGAISGGTSKGIFVTTSDFDDKAREKAQSAELKIRLIDGSELAELMYEYDIGVQIKRSIHIKEIDNNFFENY